MKRNLRFLAGAFLLTATALFTVIQTIPILCLSPT